MSTLKKPGEWKSMGFIYLAFTYNAISIILTPLFIVLGQIKLETASSETITDIQNYLDNFNKEIQSGDGTTIQPLTGKSSSFGWVGHIIWR